MSSALMNHRALRAMLVGVSLHAGLVVLAACDSGPTEPGGLQITIYTGDNQVASAGSTLPTHLAVRVTESGGRPVPDVRIRWAVEEGGGSVSSVTSPSVTDLAGIARVHRTLGPDAGVHTTTAAIDGTVGAPVNFTSIAQIQGATRMALAPGENGNAQQDTVLATLPTRFRLLVLDHEDAPVAGVVVIWTILDARGSVPAETSTTDASGIAELTHTFGERAGHSQVLASVPRLIGSPVSFEATANPGNPTEIAVVSGDSQLGTVSTALAPYIVRATDSYGNSISGITITWAVASGNGSLDQSRSVTMGLGEQGPVAAATHILGSGEDPQTVNATASDLPGAPRVTFRAIAVTALVSLVAGDSYDCWYYGMNCVPSFSPSEVSVPAGRTVGWRWGTEHNVTFEDDPTQPISSPSLVTGVHQRTFTTPGTYRYRCTIHSTSFTDGMVGQVTVQ